jgi:rfaE bifunctional protein nucleotidyltransferase chain/domain
MMNKIKTRDEIKDICDRLRAEAKKIATTNGSFDVLHMAHVKFLQEAKANADVLVVLLNSDSSVKAFKGEKRPIVPENERAGMLAALECVDYVVMFSEDKPLELLKEIKPDFHIKGGTFIPERVKEEKELVESWGGEHVTLPESEGYSTTNLINKILDSHKDD